MESRVSLRSFYNVNVNQSDPGGCVFAVNDSRVCAGGVTVASAFAGVGGAGRAQRYWQPESDRPQSFVKPNTILSTPAVCATSVKVPSPLL